MRKISGTHMGVALVAATLLSGRAAADAGLYPPPPPAGAASVRVVNVRPGGGPLKVSLGEKTVTSGPDKPTGFVYVMQGSKPISYPGYSASKPIAAGDFYSLIVGTGSAFLYKEAKPPLGQALVVLYNMTRLGDVTLKSADGSLTVVDAQAPFHIGSTPVNPLKVGFAVFAGGKKIGTIPEVQLRRGTSFGIFVLPGAEPRVIASAGPSLLN